MVQRESTDALRPTFEAWLLRLNKPSSEFRHDRQTNQFPGSRLAVLNLSTIVVDRQRTTGAHNGIDPQT